MKLRRSLVDAAAFCRATASNQLARLMPAAYVRLTRQTGRGTAPETVEEVADYFSRCFYDYFKLLQVPLAERSSFLNGKVVLEYGPGDVLGVALLMYAHGAAEVHCVDRFPLQRATPKTLAILARLLDSLEGDVRRRACSAFKREGDPSSGFDSSKVAYLVTKNGVSNSLRRYDLILSRAVLEHVDNLDATFIDMRDALRSGGVCVHLVDLKSHGLDRRAAFDFLTWSDCAYRWMYSHKGYPNRWRIDHYRELVGKYELSCRVMRPTGRLSESDIAAIRSDLAKRFRDLSTEDLSWLGFWMILEHAEAPAVAKASSETPMRR